MATSLFSLVGSIMVDNEEANKSLSKTDEKASGLGNTLLGGVKSAGKFAAGLATAAAGAVTGMVAMASETASSMDVIDKASQRMDISAESYQELSHAASLCGVEMSTLEKAAKKLEGTDVNMDQALEQIYSFGTAAERSQAAAELFGESVAYQLGPMLNASAEEFANMKQEANDLGLVMSQDTVTAGAELNDAMSNVKDSIGALGAGLASGFMPIVKQGCDMIIGFIPTLKEIINKIGPTLQKLLETVMPIFVKLIEKLLPPMLKLMDALMPIFTLLCETILPILVTVISAVVDVIADYVIPIISKVVSAIGTAISTCVEKFKTFKAKAVEIFDAIKEGIKKPINAVIGFINGLVSGVVNGINGMIRALNKISFDIPDWIPGIGGKTFGFNLSELTAPQIPLLAQGAVLEPNKPFMAIVGDQKEGTNVEAPLDTIKQALSEVLTDMGINVTVSVAPDSKGMFNMVRAEAKSYQNRTGSYAFGG